MMITRYDMRIESHEKRYEEGYFVVSIQPESNSQGEWVKYEETYELFEELKEYRQRYGPLNGE